ncbi:MAG TPA: ferrous iron transport protein B [Clostridiales bacterium]|nr:ferrous iron transport protein B [Clostridiales bacterium]
MNKIIALVGNPNSGKSTFFNNAVKAEEHVGNWHGVTTEFKEKNIKLQSEQITVTDLPGTYSLSPYSFEEAVTRDYLLSHKNCAVINILDGNNLGRNLLLTLELIELGLKPIVCINMANELKKNGTVIDVNKMEHMLGVKCFLIDAQNKTACKKVLMFANKQVGKNKKEIDLEEKINLNDIYSQLYDADDIKKIDEIFKFISKYLPSKKITYFEKIKILEQDEYVFDALLKSEKKAEITQELEKLNSLETVIQMRYGIINKILQNCVSKNDKNYVYGFSKADKYVLNKWLCFPIFILIISLIFYLTFGSFGTMLSNSLSGFFEKVVFSPLINFVSKTTSNQFIVDFISNALCGSIISIVSFLPQVVLMFFGLYVLEDSGYMSRVAFSFEDFLKKVGLSGKSIFALLMSFGCSTTATLSSRNLENKNSKIKTAMLTPYISCTAKLPIYAIVCGAFFPKYKFLIVISLYLLGIVVALLISYFLNKGVLKSNSTSFIMEFPKYRWPSLKKICKNLIYNTKQFLLRAGSVLLVFSCIIWIVQNCNFKFEYQSGKSMLESISGFIAPIFAPLGFGTSGAVSALLCGFVAKEIIVSSIGIINGLSGTSTLNDISSSLLLSTSAFCLTKSSGLSFLVFALLYLPCISTISVMIKEIGRKWTFVACLIQLTVSYAISFAVYQISKYFVFNGFISGILAIFTFVLICIFIFGAVHLLKTKNTCKFCPSKNKCNKKSNY